jgi:hypothetical protein
MRLRLLGAQAAVLMLVVAASPHLARAGASDWSYFVPYDADVGRALEKLKWEVLRKGDYYKLDPKRKPKSPREALEINDTEGTHSIMDIEKASLAEAARERCDIMTVCPLPKKELVAIFGSDRPTRAMIEAAAKKDDVAGLQQRWSGIWVVVYEKNQPKMLYFTGNSGD